MASQLIHPTKSAYSYPLLIKTILENTLKYNPENEIIYRDSFRMNYYEFNKRVARLANALKAMGVEEGDVVAVMDFDSHRYLELYFAIPMIGAVLHTINYRLSPQQMYYTMNHAEDKFVFCHSELVPLLNAIMPKLETVKQYILMTDGDEPGNHQIRFFGEYESLLKHQEETFGFPELDENTLATLFYTTGTTGKPKGVYFSHRQLVLHTQAVAMALGARENVITIDSSDIYMPITPMFHVHAWGFPYIATMLSMKQVYPGKYEPAMLVKLIQSEKVTISHCVPTILNMLVSSPAAGQFDWSKWRVIIGGSALPEGLARAALKIGINVISGYGMSETCPVLTLAYLDKKMMETLTPDEQINERCKTGRPIPFVELHIMDEGGNILPNDGKALGEIVVRTPWLTQGYFKEVDRSEALWEYGYMHTGDMATIEPNGTVMIRDRKKDVIKTGGEWVSSLELENIISAHPAVQEVAVVGIPDEKWGERPFALIVLKQGQSADKDAIHSHLTSYINSGHLSKWAMPDEVRFVSEIPKTSVGKIDKKKIREDMGQ